MSRNKKSWRCFHCAEVFTDTSEARAHFGETQCVDPACQVDVERVRATEIELARYREEDTDLHRQIRAMESQHQMEIRRAEESGYLKGLRDARELSAEPQPSCPA